MVTFRCLMIPWRFPFKSGIQIWSIKADRPPAHIAEALKRDSRLIALEPPIEGSRGCTRF